MISGVNHLYGLRGVNCGRDYYHRMITMAKRKRKTWDSSSTLRPAFGGTAEDGHDREGVHQELQKLSIA